MSEAAEELPYPVGFALAEKWAKFNRGVKAAVDRRQWGGPAGR
ncbi:MAG: hypothetical protein AAF656_00060 [Planctomycetota bacterium]